MSDLRKAAQQALEALDNIDKEFKKHGRQHWPEAVKARNAAPALRAALAEPVQEPVAWIDDSGHPKHIRHLQSVTERRLYGPLRPLYTAPPQRKPLTEEQVDRAYQEIWRDSPDDFGPTAGDWIEAGIRYAERVHGIIATKVNGDKS